MLATQVVARFVKFHPGKSARFGRAFLPINSYGTLQKSIVFKKNDGRSDQHQSKRGSKNFGHRIGETPLITKLWLSFLGLGFFLTFVDFPV